MTKRGESPVRGIGQSPADESSPKESREWKATRWGWRGIRWKSLNSSSTTPNPMVREVDAYNGEVYIPTLKDYIALAVACLAAGDREGARWYAAKARTCGAHTAG